MTEVLRQDVDAMVDALFAFEQARLMCFYHDARRLDSASMCVGTNGRIDAIARAVEETPRVRSVGGRMQRYVEYGGCTFWAPAEEGA